MRNNESEESDLRSVAPNLPLSNSWPGRLGEFNEPLVLYRGRVDFTQHGSTFSADASIVLKWVPTPRISFEILDSPIELQSGEILLRLDDGTSIENSYIVKRNISIVGGVERVDALGVVRDMVLRPKDGRVSYSLFLVPNFDAPFGDGVTYPDGSRGAARLTLIGDDWNITLDAVEDRRAVIDKLKAVSGFGITQIGRLERQSGRKFNAKEATEILDALRLYLSFAHGQWVAPCLVRGFDTDAAQQWERWSLDRTEPYRRFESWMDPVHREHFEGPFAGFIKLWNNLEWSEIVRTAIHWYIESNAQAGAIAGSIVLTQTAFELLASGVLVENHGWLSVEGYEKLSAADRIRLLFRWAGLSLEIPPELAKLTSAARAENWSDSPTAMTAIRNTITHPTKKNREKFGKHPLEVRVEVWRLGLWYLELCLLRLFEYKGTYANRISRKCVGDVSQVPWA